MTFSKAQQKLEHRSNPAYQGAHGHAPEAEEARHGSYWRQYLSLVPSGPSDW